MVSVGNVSVSDIGKALVALDDERRLLVGERDMLKQRQEAVQRQIESLTTSITVLQIVGKAIES